MNSVLGGTLGFGVKRADIPGLQRHLLDVDPYTNGLTEELWEMVCVLSGHIEDEHEVEALHVVRSSREGL